MRQVFLTTIYSDGKQNSRQMDEVLFSIGGGMSDLNVLLEEFSDKEKNAATTMDRNVLVHSSSGFPIDELLVARTLFMLSKGSKVLFLASSRARCIELMDIIRVCGNPEQKNYMITTLDSFCLEEIRQNPEAATGWDSYSVWDVKDQMGIFTGLLEDKKTKVTAADILAEIVRSKNALLSSEEYRNIAGVNSSSAMTIADVFSSYEVLLKRNQALDPTDVISAALRKLDADSSIIDKKWHIVVEEFQDVTPVRFQLLKALASHAASTFVIGDSSRTLADRVFSGEAAVKSRTQQFNPLKEFRLLNKKVSEIYLQEGLELGERLRKYARNLHSPDESGPGGVSAYEATNEIDEANFLIRRIRENIFKHRLRYGDFAIIYRRDEQLQALKQLMKKHGLPHYLLGESLFLKPSVKDLISYGRLFINHRDDEALSVIINLPRRGVGKRTLESLELMSREQDISLEDAIYSYSESDDLPSRTRSILKSFMALVERYRKMAKEKNAYEVFTKLIDEIDLKKHYTKQNTAAAERQWNAIENFMEFLKERIEDEPNLPLDLVVNSSALSSESDHATIEHNAVALAKATRVHGTRFPIVFVVGLEEGLFPYYRNETKSDASALSRVVDAERRLFYLAITRASQALCLVWAKERRLRTVSTKSECSRFVDELPSELFEVESADEEKLQEATRPAPGDLMPQVEITVRSYSLGDTVNHPMWGLGRVVAQQGAGASAELTVDFVNEGRKTLLLKYAPLKKVVPKK